RGCVGRRPGLRGCGSGAYGCPLRLRREGPYAPARAAVRRRRPGRPPECRRPGVPVPGLRGIARRRRRSRPAWQLRGDSGALAGRAVDPELAVEGGDAVGQAAQARAVGGGAADAVLVHLDLQVAVQALPSRFGLEIPAGGIVLAPRTVLISLLVGVLVSAASAVLPARKAPKAPPISALRDLAHDSAGRSRRRVVIGAAVSAAGVTALSLGLLLDPKRMLLVGLGAATIFIGAAVLGPVIAAPAS